MFPSRRIAVLGGDAYRDEHSVAFDGTNDNLGSNFMPNYIHTNATFAMWIKMGDFTSTQSLGAHNSKRWYFGFNGTDGMIGIANANKDDITITPTPVAGEWLHYAVTAIDGTATLYINGVAQGDTLSYTQASATNPDAGFYIGERLNALSTADVTAQTPMNCSISDVVQYNVGLTASDIKTIYNGREPFNHKEWAKTSNCVQWLRMGDSGGDLSSANNKDHPLIINKIQGYQLGTEVCTDPQFGDAGEWVIQESGTTTINDSSDGNLVFTNTTSGQYVRQSPLTAGTVYRVEISITAISEGKIRIALGKNAGNASTNAIATTGVHVNYLQCRQYTHIYFMAVGETSATVDYISVKEVLGNPALGDDGALITGESFS
jgi:hypothetical protein